MDIQSCLTLCDPMDTRLLRPWDFLGKSTGVGCHFLLQGIFPTQGSNPGLLHCRQTLYHLSHQGSPSYHYYDHYSEQSTNFACICAKLLQSCLILCDPMNCSPPGSSFHGILHARIVEWVAISLLQGNLPKPGMELMSPMSPALQVDALPLSHQISKNKNTRVGCYAFLQD